MQFPGKLCEETSLQKHIQNNVATNRKHRAAIAKMNTSSLCLALWFYVVGIMGTFFKICKMSHCYLKRNDEWAWRNIYHFLRWCSATGSELCFSFLMQDNDIVTVLKEHRSCIKPTLHLHSGSPCVLEVLQMLVACSPDCCMCLISLSTDFQLTKIKQKKPLLIVREK